MYYKNIFFSAVKFRNINEQFRNIIDQINEQLF